MKIIKRAMRKVYKTVKRNAAAMVDVNTWHEIKSF